MADVKKTSAKKTSAKKTETLSAEERAAVKERAAELKAAGKGGRGKASGEEQVLAKIAAMAKPDREMAERIHQLVLAAAPELTPKTWYGMPAYARNGKVVVFFQDAAKFKERYATLGFSGAATLDDGSMWPTAYALTTLTKADEATITKLVKKAAN